MAETKTRRAVFDHLGRVAPQSGWRMDAHVHHEFHELILVLHGGIVTHIRGATYHGQRGDVLFYPARQLHAEQASGSEPLETLFLGWQWQPGHETTSDAWPLLVHDRNGRIAMLMQWSRELYPPGRPDDQPKLDVLLDALLYEYENLAQSPRQTLTGQVKAFIQRHLDEPIHLDQLAAEVGLSKYHFSREFKRQTGMAPMTFLRQERIAAARSLLLSTPWTLQSIAVQVGLADEFQLSRMFRRLTGQSPSQVRRGG